MDAGDSNFFSDPDWVRLVVDLAQITALVIVTIYTWLGRRQAATRAAIEQVEARMDKHEQRLMKMESAVEHLPNHDDIIRIHQRLDEVTRLQSENTGQMKAAVRQLEMINEHLLNKERS